MPPTICGNELPARFTLVSAGTEPATSSRVDSGRLIVEFTDSAGTGVSVSWPPAPRALYGDAPDYRIFPNTADSMIGPDGRTTAQRLTFLDTRQNEFDVDQGDAIGPVLDIEEFGGPSPLDDLPAECGRVEVAPLGMEASDATEIGRYAIDLFWLGQEDASFAARDARGSHLVDLSPRVTSSEMVDVLPRSEPVQCDDESVPSESAPVVEPQVFPTSAEALDTFLDTNPAATTFIPTGWHEMVSDGAVGYGIPFDDVPGGPTSQTKMITVVYVEQTSDGWVVTDWISSGC